MLSKNVKIGLPQLVFFTPSIRTCMAALINKAAPEMLRTSSSSAEKTVLKLMSKRFDLALLQKKVVVDGTNMVWSTGFRTIHGQMLYGHARERESAHGTMRWVFEGWYSEHELKKNGLSAPAEVLFFTSGKLPKYNVDVEMSLSASFHLVERKSRLPWPYCAMEKSSFKLALLKALESMRIALNNGLISATPIFNEQRGGQLVVPLCMNGNYVPGSEADASVVLAQAYNDAGSPYYYCSTILSKDMTFYDARLVAAVSSHSWIRTGKLEQERGCA